MKNFSFLIALLFSIGLKGQPLLSINPNAKEYKLVCEADSFMQLGNYIIADSLYTFALRNYRNETIYFNRAVSKLNLTDTIGYCQDMDIAANEYFDAQAQGFFCDMCCTKVDTIFYNKKREKSDKSDYRYYEIIKHPTYDTIIKGSFHDIKRNRIPGIYYYGSYNTLGFPASYVTDLIANYEIHNGTRYYIKTTELAYCNKIDQYMELRKNAKKYLSAKYSNLKKTINKDELTLFYKVYIDETGIATDVSFEGFFPIIDHFDDIDELKKDLRSIMLKYPKVKPAKFYREKVSSAFYDGIKF